MSAAAAAAPFFNPFTPAAIRSADSSLLKTMLDDPVQFREAPVLVGTVDPTGKGWFEVNPLPGSAGAKAKASKPSGAKETHPHAREQPVASSSTLSPAPAASASAKGKGKVIYGKPITLDFPPQKQTIGSGLHNTGNSCYANSVLQAVLHTPGFARYVTDPDHRQASVCAVGKSKKHEFHCQHCAIRAVIHNSFNLNKAAYTPTVITNNLKKIGKTLRKGRQEDAHEFLRFLIDGLQNAALFPFGDPNKLPAEFKYTTGVHQLFGGELRSRVTCQRCNHHSDTRDAFLDLSIEVRGCRSVQAGFAKFVKPDVLDGQNKYKCEKCNKLVVASKGLTISKAPKALMIQLRRFTPTGGKLNDTVAYDQTFDITPYMSAGSAGAKYSLYAVVCHSGSGPHSGHYTSRVLSTDGGRWHMMDDSSVYPLNGGGSKPPLGLREAYLLMYIRQKGGALDEAIHGGADSKAAGKQQAKQQQLPSPAKPVLGPLPAAVADAASSNKLKRRISQIPDEADRTLPSPAPSSSAAAPPAAKAAPPSDSDEDISSDDDDDDDVGRPAGPLRLNSPLVARSTKKARVDGGLPTPSATPSSASASPKPSSPPALPQGLGPRPIGFHPGAPSSTSAGAAEKKDSGAGKRRPKKHHKLPGHGGWKDPFGTSLAGKGGHKLKKGLVKNMRGRP